MDSEKQRTEAREVSESSSKERRHSHHSSSHHQHHHHKSKKSRRSTAESREDRRRRLRHFWKQNRVQIICFGIIALLLVAIIVLQLLGFGLPAGTAQPTGGQEAPSAEGQERITLTVPYFSAPVSLIGDAARALYAADESLPAASVLAGYRRDGVRLDTGLAVELSYEVGSLPAGIFIMGAKLEVAESLDFADALVYYLDSSTRTQDVYYLKSNTQYYYRFTVSLSDGTEAFVNSGFVTAAGPRILSLAGLVNVRDIGGWGVGYGQTVRQGLLYRGSELDGAVESGYDLTEQGLLNALTVLGIRTDMDLRAPTDNLDGTHALGANVTHIYYDAPMYEAAFTAEGKETMRRIFSDLARPELYPVYLHCTYGMDRTGTVCCILEGLLGMEEEKVVREYAFSSLYHPTVEESNILTVIDGLNAYEGRDLQEKCRNYLLSAGVTEAELESICTIFLGE